MSNIDKALLRKGRLIARYEFKELEVSKANALSKKLGFTNTISTPQSLAAIYNQAEMDFGEVQKANRIGF